MCMALPGGGQPDPPASFLQRVFQWVGFGALVVRFGLAWVFAWFTYRRARKA